MSPYASNKATKYKILIEDIVMSILKKIYLQWKLSPWYVFECLCVSWNFQLPEMAKIEIWDFSGPTCMS